MRDAVFRSLAICHAIPAQRLYAKYKRDFPINFCLKPELCMSKICSETPADGFSNAPAPAQP